MEFLNTKDDIISAVPELTGEDYEMMDSEFTSYLFIKDHNKEGYRECWCTACGQHFFYEHQQRTENSEHYEFLSAKHNISAKCPMCGKMVTVKKTQFLKTCSSLWECKRIVHIKKISKNEVYLLCFYGTKNYKNKGYLVKPEYELATIYYLTPGKVHIFKLGYFGFSEVKSICEPFTKTWWYNISLPEKRGYTLTGYCNLKNTFLEYAPVDIFCENYLPYKQRKIYYGYYRFIEEPIVKFFCYYALYPSTEKLLKLGLDDFVCNLIDGIPMKRYINWNAKTPKAMFGMNKAQFKELRENYYGIVDFKIYQNIKHINPSYKFTAELIKKFGDEGALRLTQSVKKHGLNLIHTLNYITKKTKGKQPSKFDFEHTAILWTDYVSLAEKLKYDFSRKDSDIYFPKNLKKAHDAASKNLTIEIDKKAFEKYLSRYENLCEMYKFSNDRYQIVIPNGIQDIIEEGKILHHCVGGYAERHINGKTTILFMRKSECPDDRLVTIEIDDKSKIIRQNYGFKNRRVTKEEQAFIDEWLSFVRAGGNKKKKDKKTAENAA